MSDIFLSANRNCFNFNGDCDADTGDIDFSGDVVINGNVYAGASIKAAGNIEVLGVVEGAVLQAQGDIILRNGVFAAGKGMVVSQASVIASSIENATVEAKKAILAGSVLHSNLFCIGTIQANSIVGGNTFAGRQITAKTIGSPVRTPTYLEVGMLPKYREREAQIEQESSQCDADIVRLLQLAKGLPDNRPEAVKEIRKRITHDLLSLRQKKIALAKETQEIAALFFAVDGGQVQVTEHAYAQCKITLGSVVYPVEWDGGAVTFKLVDSSVVTNS